MDQIRGINPAAPHQLPPFVAAPGETDVLMVAMGIFLVLSILSVGIFYLKLHALPEQMAHKGQKVQFQIVAVLALIALFTHNHLFWIAGLLLALIQIPDFSSPLGSIARSLETLAGRTGAAEPDLAGPESATATLGHYAAGPDDPTKS